MPEKQKYRRSKTNTRELRAVFRTVVGKSARARRRTALSIADRTTGAARSGLPLQKKISCGHFDGESLLRLRVTGSTEDETLQSAGALGRVSMKARTGVAGLCPHRCHGAMMGAIRAAARWQVQLRRCEHSRSQVAPEHDQQHEIGKESPHQAFYDGVLAAG